MEFLVPFILIVTGILIWVGLWHRKVPVQAGGYRGEGDLPPLVPLAAIVQRHLEDWDREVLQAGDPLLDPERPAPRTSSDWFDAPDWDWPDRG